MKKILIIAITMTILLLSGCQKTSAVALLLEFDREGNYTGFMNLPTQYSDEEAEKDGFYTRVNSEIVSGEQLWEDFIEDASNGKNASLRIVNIWDEEAYFLDLFYWDGSYRIFDSSSEDLQDYKFQHMLVLEGKLSNAARGDKVIVLTDDKELTYKDVMWKYLSSDMSYIESISPFRLVMIE